MLNVLNLIGLSILTSVVVLATATGTAHLLEYAGFSTSVAGFSAIFITAVLAVVMFVLSSKYSK